MEDNIEKYLERFHDPKVTVWDFMCLFCASNVQKGNYKFDRKMLINFISYCKKNGKFNNLLHEIIIKNNGIDDYSDDIDGAIQNLKKSGLVYSVSPSVDSSILIFNNFPLQKIVEKREEYLNEMENFFGAYIEFASQNVKDGDKQDTTSSKMPISRELKRK